MSQLSLLQIRVKFIANWAGNFIKNQAIFNTTWGKYYKLGKLCNFERVFQINAVITNWCWTIESSSGFESWTHGLVIQCPHPCLLLHASTRPLLDCSFLHFIFLRKHIKGNIPPHYLHVNENSKNGLLLQIIYYVSSSIQKTVSTICLVRKSQCQK